MVLTAANTSLLAPVNCAQHLLLQPDRENKKCDDLHNLSNKLT
jgi:hypothetical protein